MLETFFFHLGIFWIGVGISTLIDWHFENTQTLTQHTLQKKDKIDWSLYKKCAQTSLFNQITITLPISYLGELMFQYIGMYDDYSQVSLLYLCGQFGAMFVMEDIMFYYVHRLFHNDYFYPIIHKQHHQLVAPMAVGVFYAHPIEHLIANVMPVILAPAIVGLKYPYFYVWFFIATINGLISHSGWNLPLIRPKLHDDHHRYRDYNYGIIGLCDWIHQTLKISDNPTKYFWG